MKDVLMLLCSESIYLIESCMVILGYVFLMEYRWKHLKLGILVQVLFIYVFQKMTLNISIFFTGSTGVGIIINAMVGLSVGCICYKGAIIKKVAVYFIYMGPALISELIAYNLLYMITMRNKILVSTIAVFFKQMNTGISE